MQTRLAAWISCVTAAACSEEEGASQASLPDADGSAATGGAASGGSSGTTGTGGASASGGTTSSGGGAVVEVSTAADLMNAVANAENGATIELVDGTYYLPNILRFRGGTP